jgi:RHS repeat-associated protein
VRASDGQLYSAWSGTQSFKVTKLAGGENIRFAKVKLTGLNGVQVATIGSLGGLTGGETEAIFFYHTDHLGTPLMLTDQTGQVVWSAESLPFGEPVSVNEDVDGDGVVVTNNLRFPGQYQDQETGLNQNWHREYNAKIGRYIESDPIGLDVGKRSMHFVQRGINHIYGYVTNNPVRLTDPSGLALSYPPCLLPQIEKCKEDSAEVDRGAGNPPCVRACTGTTYTLYFGGEKSNCKRSGIFSDISHQFMYDEKCLMDDLIEAIASCQNYIKSNCPCCHLPESCTTGMSACIHTMKE